MVSTLSPLYDIYASTGIGWSKTIRTRGRELTFSGMINLHTRDVREVHGPSIPIINIVVVVVVVVVVTTTTTTSSSSSIIIIIIIRSTQMVAMCLWCIQDIQCGISTDSRRAFGLLPNSKVRTLATTRLGSFHRTLMLDALTYIGDLIVIAGGRELGTSRENTVTCFFCRVRFGKGLPSLKIQAK